MYNFHDYMCSNISYTILNNHSTLDVGTGFCFHLCRHFDTTDGRDFKNLVLR